MDVLKYLSSIRNKVIIRGNHEDMLLEVFSKKTLDETDWCRIIIDYAERPLVRPDYDVEETMSFCKHCGAPTRFAHNFCGICGEPL